MDLPSIYALYDQDSRSISINVTNPKEVEFEIVSFICISIQHWKTGGHPNNWVEYEVNREINYLLRYLVESNRVVYSEYHSRWIVIEDLFNWGY